MVLKPNEITKITFFGSSEMDRRKWYFSHLIWFRDHRRNVLETSQMFGIIFETKRVYVKFNTTKMTIFIITLY